MNVSSNGPSRLSRYATAVAASAAAGVLAAVAAAVPASAVTASDASAGACTVVTGLHYNPTSRVVTAIHERTCETGQDIPLAITLRRNGVIKATGKGTVRYTCRGSVVGTWTSPREEEVFPCS